MAELSEVFEKIIEHTLRHEGGLSMDPNDAGNWAGKELRGTKYGISAQQYPNIDIESLTKDGAIAIYRADFWAPIENMLAQVWGDELDANRARCAALMFDIAVNSGHGNMLKVIQLAGGVMADGLYGRQTEGVLHRLEFLELCFARITFYAGIKTFNIYGKGWIMRTMKLKRDLMRIYQ